MTPKVKNLYNTAKKDQNFNEEIKGYLTGLPFIWTNNEKVLYASVYMGWLIGKGKFNESDFE